MLKVWQGRNCNDTLFVKKKKKYMKYEESEKVFLISKCLWILMGLVFVFLELLQYQQFNSLLVNRVDNSLDAVIKLYLTMFLFHFSMKFGWLAYKLIRLIWNDFSDKLRTEPFKIGQVLCGFFFGINWNRNRMLLLTFHLYFFVFLCFCVLF